MAWYHGIAVPKGPPRIVTQLAKKAALAKEERRVRKLVDQRDHRRCFWPTCKRRASEKHHVIARSVRGKTVWRTDDLLSACNFHHSFFKAGLIQVLGNPDHGPVQVVRTALGREQGIRVPHRT